MKQSVLIITIFILGYLLAIIFRSINGIRAPNLIADINLTASSLGFLTSTLLIAHALAQIPLGVYLDSHGPKKVQITLLLLAAVGCVIFALSSNIYVMTFARLMIGVGFSGALMSGFRAVSMYLKPENAALGNGIIMSAGQVGLLVTSWPTEYLLNFFTWRGTYGVFIILIFIVVFLTYILIPKQGYTDNSKPVIDRLRDLKIVLRDPSIWRLGPLVWITGGSHIALLTLWAGPWFSSVASYGRDDVATGLTINAIAAISGIFFSGLTAKILHRFNIGILKILTVILITHIFSLIPIIFFSPNIGAYFWIIFAMTGQGGILSYPWVTAKFGMSLSSRANTIVNLGTFVIAFFIQWLVGVVIDLFPLINGITYNPMAFNVSFMIILAMQIMVLFWYFSGLRYLKLDNERT
jgi:MFS family permease